MLELRRTATLLNKTLEDLNNYNKEPRMSSSSQSLSTRSLKPCAETLACENAGCRLPGRLPIIKNDVWMTAAESAPPPTRFFLIFFLRCDVCHFVTV